MTANDRLVILAMAGALALAGQSHAVFAHSPASTANSPWSLGSSAVLAGSLAGGGLLYRNGAERLRELARRGSAALAWREVSFYVALVALLVALTAPMEVLAEDRFSAHMFQHVLLIFVAAPLLAVSRPTTTVLMALPVELRSPLVHARLVRGVRRLWHWASRPIVGWPVFFLAVWGWHAPALYEAAEANPLLHAFEHATLLGAAVIFFRPVLGRANPGLWSVPYLFATALHMTVLGALMVFSSEPWYSTYSSSQAHTFDPLRDQQIAGMVMSAGGSVAVLATAAAAFISAMGLHTPARTPISLPRIAEGDQR